MVFKSAAECLRSVFPSTSCGAVRLAWLLQGHVFECHKLRPVEPQSLKARCSVSLLDSTDKVRVEPSFYQRTCINFHQAESRMMPSISLSNYLSRTPKAPAIPDRLYLPYGSWIFQLIFDSSLVRCSIVWMQNVAPWQSCRRRRIWQAFPPILHFASRCIQWLSAALQVSRVNVHIFSFTSKPLISCGYGEPHRPSTLP